MQRAEWHPKRRALTLAAHALGPLLRGHPARASYAGVVPADAEQVVSLLELWEPRCGDRPALGQRALPCPL
jgi:hypothetical protein